MASSFPVGLDSFTDPVSGNFLNSPSHSTLHADVNDAIAKIQAKVGIDDSAVATSIDYFMNNAVQSRGFSWGVEGALAAGDGQGMSYIVPAGMTTTKLKAYVSSGSGVAIRIKKNGSSIKTLSSIGTTVSSSNVTESLAENDKLTLDITTASDGVDLWVVLECEQSLT